MQFHKGLSSLKFTTFLSSKSSQGYITLGFLLLLASCQQGTITAIETPEPSPVVEVLSAEFSHAGGELGIVIDEKNTVLGIENSSAAEQSGIQIGDILEALDDIPFTEKDRVRRKIQEPEAEKPLKLRLRRKGEEIIFDIRPLPRAPQMDASTPTPVWPPNDYF